MIGSVSGREAVVRGVVDECGNGVEQRPGFQRREIDGREIEIRDGVFPIPEVQPPAEGIVELFDGPELGEEWSVRDDSVEAQIGFTGDGRYQVNEPSTSAGGDAGIRRSFTSGGSFTADLKMHFEDFIGSHTDSLK